MAIPTTTTTIAGTVGTLAAPGAVALTEVISATHVGDVLEVTNGSVASINVTFVDPGKTPAGNVGTEDPVPVAAGARRRWLLTAAFVGPSKTITVTFSAIGAGIVGELIAG